MQKQPIILVVDDEPAILGLVKEILRSADYLVNTATNGKEALVALQAHPYDLVITDMIMPQMGGMELVKYLRLHHPETLVIVFTGFASYQDAVQAVKIGAFDYLPKPVQPESCAMPSSEPWNTSVYAGPNGSWRRSSRELWPWGGKPWSWFRTLLKPQFWENYGNRPGSRTISKRWDEPSWKPPGHCSR
jgi:CheY-like chemotaxis protein